MKLLKRHFNSIHLLPKTNIPANDQFYDLKNNRNLIFIYIYIEVVAIQRHVTAHINEICCEKKNYKME